MTRKTAVDLQTFQAERVAFLKPSALGDLLHALPTLEAVRIRFPAARITWIVNQSLAPLVAGHPAIDDVLMFDRAGLKGSFRKAWGVLKEFRRNLRSRQFDLVLDLQGLARSGLMAWQSGAPVRVGLSNAREGSRHAYTHVLPAPPLLSQHAVERNWLFAEALGVGDLPKRFRLPTHKDDAEKIEQELQAYPRPWVALAPGARWLTKRWPIESYAGLITRIEQSFGGTFFSVGGPEDQPLADELSRLSTRPIIHWIGRTNLPTLTELLRRMDLVISNDSGPLHLAAALGVAVVAPYTCTKVALHGPYGQFERGVETKVSCAGSYITTCPTMHCMPELTIERVFGPVADVLTRRTAVSHRINS